MQNPFMMLDIQFQVKVLSKSRWPSNVILKHELLNYVFIVVDFTCSEPKTVLAYEYVFLVIRNLMES